MEVDQDVRLLTDPCPGPQDSTPDLEGQPARGIRPHQGHYRDRSPPSARRLSRLICWAAQWVSFSRPGQRLLRLPSHGNHGTRTRAVRYAPWLWRRVVEETASVPSDLAHCWADGVSLYGRLAELLRAARWHHPGFTGFPRLPHQVASAMHHLQTATHLRPGTTCQSLLSGIFKIDRSSAQLATSTASAKQSAPRCRCCVTLENSARAPTMQVAAGPLASPSPGQRRMRDPPVST